jgi:hypothetical protein
VKQDAVSDFMKFRQRGIDSHMRSARDHVAAAPVGLTPQRHQEIKGAFNRWITDWKRSPVSPNAKLSVDAPELVKKDFEAAKLRLRELAAGSLRLVEMGYTKPGLRDRIKARIMASSKGGRPGQWSARKAQLVAQEYRAEGGGYKGGKTKSQKSLRRWTREKWGTRSGKPSTQGPEATGERYLPESANKALSPQEYGATTRAKREGTRRGEQFVKQPERIAKKTAKHRL